eukprot:GCRY01003554.1.p1 GENE.GCRY01003554.1~~GCRY01003554.1.p1  ORF type:complete len:235 (+),score=27.03 GCRY01003554.1:161-865(+)
MDNFEKEIEKSCIEVGRVVTKDFPRLYKRMKITKDGQTIVERRGSESDEKGTHMKLILSSLIKFFCFQNEAERKLEKLDQLFAKNSENQNEFGEQRLFIEDIIDNCLGKHSKEVAVLKSIHQGVILTAAFHLKSALSGSEMTKDIRDHRGWLVNVDLQPDVVCVTHIRREQSLAVSQDSYEIEWQVRITFSTKTMAVQAASLRITDLQMADNISAAKREQLERLYSRGSLILSP